MQNALWQAFVLYNTKMNVFSCVSSDKDLFYFLLFLKFDTNINQHKVAPQWISC